MTKSQALFVKWLRVRQEGTWRWVHSEYVKRYPAELEDESLAGNQILGMELCNEAMDILNETTNDNWN